MKTMPTILVTGAAGYIGSVLVPELLKHSCKVVAVDNCMYGQKPFVDIHNNDFTFVRGDIRDKNLVTNFIKGVGYIIPLAAIVGAPACDKNPRLAKEVNLNAIKMLLKIRKPNQKIIFPTTNSGYGIGQEGIFCDETTPLNPISLYSRTKVEAERAVLAAKNSITYRLATVFGTSPRMRLDLLVNDFTHRALRDKKIVIFEPYFKRNYIHIRDVARAFLHAIENFDSMKDEPYNVGLSEANLSKRELCEKIKKYIPSLVIEESAGEDPDKRNYIVSNAKIEAAGFKPAFPLDYGINELIKEYPFSHYGSQLTNI